MDLPSSSGVRSLYFVAQQPMHLLPVETAVMENDALPFCFLFCVPVSLRSVMCFVKMGEMSPDVSERVTSYISACDGESGLKMGGNAHILTAWP